MTKVTPRCAEVSFRSYFRLRSNPIFFADTMAGHQ